MGPQLVPVLCPALLLCACASVSTASTEIERARSAVQIAAADPNVVKYAITDLEAAQKKLSLAESAALNHADAEAAQHAYLASQTARLAQLHASARADEAEISAVQATLVQTAGQQEQLSCKKSTDSK